MEKLEELKGDWKQHADDASALKYDDEAMKKLVRERVKKHTGMTMRYFWPAFFCQLLVYAMLSHVIVKYWGHTALMLAAIAGITVFIPFTWMLMKKFKSMATLRVGYRGITNMHEYVLQQRDLVKSFFRFKQLYELFLIPIASLIGVWIAFELFVPGGVMLYPNGALTCFVITLISCLAAIVNENKRNFREPLRELNQIVDDFGK